MKKQQEKCCSFFSDTRFTYPALAAGSTDGNNPGTTEYEDKFVPTKGKLQIKPQLRDHPSDPDFLILHFFSSLIHKKEKVIFEKKHV